MTFRFHSDPAWTQRACVANLSSRQPGLAAQHFSRGPTRKIEGGAVEIDVARITDRGLTLAAGRNPVFQVGGSRQFAKLSTLEFKSGAPDPEC